jgi:hypothetical protein
MSSVRRLSVLLCRFEALPRSLATRNLGERFIILIHDPVSIQTTTLAPAFYD